MKAEAAVCSEQIYPDCQSASGMRSGQVCEENLQMFKSLDVLMNRVSGELRIFAASILAPPTTVLHRDLKARLKDLSQMVNPN